MNGSAWVATALSGGIVLVVACGGSTESPTKASGSPTPSASSASSSTGGPPATTASSTSSTSSSGYSSQAPTCADGGVSNAAYNIVRVDDSHIRIVQAAGSVAEVCAGNSRRPDDCSYDYFDFLFTFPAGTKDGWWDLPSSEVTLTRTKYFPRTISSTSVCTCQPADFTPVEIRQGAIGLKNYVDPGYPDYEGSIMFNRIPLLAENIDGDGTLRTIYQACP